MNFQNEDIKELVYHSYLFGKTIALKLSDRDEILPVAIDWCSVDGNVILISEMTLYGKPVMRREICIDDLEYAYLFKSKYHEPTFQQIREIRESIRSMNLLYKRNILGA